MSLARKAAIIMCSVFPLLAAPRLTTIQDTIYKADGTRFNGAVVISWMPFDASDDSKIGMQSLTTQIINGAIRIQLVPNSDANPVNSYNVQYNSDGKQQFMETWSVPPSTTVLRIKDIRIVQLGSTGGGVVTPPSQSPITESNVIGLLTDLSLRPVKGSSYGNGRTAMVNDNGAIDAVEGTLSDCVRVDGTAGPCFDSSMVPSYVDNETPGGVVDGSNATFTVANGIAPVASLALYRNGLLQQAGVDYNIQTDGSIVFGTACVPQPADVLLASYRNGGASAPVMAPQSIQSSRTQVLCSGAGISSTSLSAFSLGSCLIPAGTLAVGDRLEVRFSLSHQGSAVGFVFSVLWGQATMVQRIASRSDAVVTGHGDASVGSVGATLDMQTWGSVLSLESRVAAATDAPGAGIKVDFQVSMSAAGTDSVSLQNYIILRYPAQ